MSPDFVVFNMARQTIRTDEEMVSSFKGMVMYDPHIPFETNASRNDIADHRMLCRSAVIKPADTCSCTKE